MITRNHWIAAAMLAALICGVSFGQEAKVETPSKVETPNQKLLVLCKDPEATPEAIELLLRAGADIRASDEYNRTPLMLAVESNTNPEVIEAILKAGTHIEARHMGGQTPLMLAAESDTNPKVIEAILREGATPNAKDKEGNRYPGQAIQGGPSL